MFRRSSNVINSIICVGGAHTSGAKCVNDYSRVADDPNKKTLNIQDDPHPDNKANAYWVHITPVMQIGTLLVSKPHWDNLNIMFNALDYVRRKQHPEDTIAVVGFEKWTSGSDVKDVIDFHEQLKSMNVPHIMFNTSEHLDVPLENQYDFGDSYIDPYNPAGTMVSRLKAQNIDFNPGTEYFGIDGHKRWARVLLKYLTQIA